MVNRKRLRLYVIGLVLSSGLLGCSSDESAQSEPAEQTPAPASSNNGLCEQSPKVCLDSLAQLSISALAARNYGSELTLLSVVRQQHGRDTLIASFSAADWSLS